MANAHVAMHHYRQADIMYSSLLDSVSKPGRRVNLLRDIAISNYNTHNFGRAISYGTQALRLSKQIGLTSFTDDIYLVLSRTYEHMNVFDSAYHYLLTRDSFIRDQIESERIKLEKKLEIELGLEKKEYELSLANHKAKTMKKNIIHLVIASTIFLLLTIIIFFFWRNSEIKKRQIKKQKEYILHHNRICAFGM